MLTKQQILLKTKRKPRKDIERRFFIDKYNINKIWEVAYLKGTYLIRQYIKNNDNSFCLLGKGSRRNEKELKELGILDFKELTNIQLLQGEKTNGIR
ncbi:hypothetical protein [Tissierella creatinophila]|uniref:Uncharacterized protein n=1 Tax=Tissierella creatinophila DSM 6911 TaxID=1123403 RepID=A0A1U7M6I3_TISCR|nr:hypothetical protein [Tissierella creatinophila]OLS02917.1 hypothetical protein TICRE_10710 [Tissierella creatinophila DSM 6911]